MLWNELFYLLRWSPTNWMKTSAAQHFIKPIKHAVCVLAYYAAQHSSWHIVSLFEGKVWFSVSNKSHQICVWSTHLLEIYKKKNGKHERYCFWKTLIDDWIWSAQLFIQFNRLAYNDNLGMKMTLITAHTVYTVPMCIYDTITMKCIFDWWNEVVLGTA